MPLLPFFNENISDEPMGGRTIDWMMMIIDLGTLFCI